MAIPGTLTMAALAVAAAAIATYLLLPADSTRTTRDQATTMTPSPTSNEALQALARMNGRPCHSALSITRISQDDYNLECAIGADGAQRAMYLVNLKAGTVK